MINQKKYNWQIRQNNIHYINKITIKDVIILKKTKKKEKPSIDILDTIALTKMAKILSFVDFSMRYK